MHTNLRNSRRVSYLLDRSFRPATLLPAVVLLLLLTVLPVLSLGRMAVSTIEVSEGQYEWSFTPSTNVGLLQNDNIFPVALVNTAIFVGVAVAAQMVLGFGLALVASRLGRGRGFLRTVMMLPILIPPVAIGSMWRLLYNFNSGPINAVATGIGLDPVNWLGSPSVALWAVIIVDIWHWTPFVFLLMLAGVESLPQELFEAAEVDGASRWQMVRRITVPLMMPTIWVALVFRMLGAFRVFDEILLLTSGGPGTSTEVASLYIFKVFFEQSQLGYGALLSIITVGALLGGLWLLRRGQRTVEGLA